MIKRQFTKFLEKGMRGGLSPLFSKQKEQTNNNNNNKAFEHYWTSELLNKLDSAHLRNFRVHQFRFYINTSDAVGEWDPSRNDHLNRTNF